VHHWLLVKFLLLKLYFSLYCFSDHFLLCFTFSFDHCIVCPSINGI
jgi:hypothetical protein